MRHRRHPVLYHPVADASRRLPTGPASRTNVERFIRAVTQRCRAMARTARDEAGFTLIEVVAAIAILSLALGVLLGLIGNSIRQTAQSERMVEAGSLAQSLLAQLGSEIPIREWQGTGQFPGGFRWRVSLESFGDAEDRRQWPVNAYKVTVEITWDDGPRSRSYALATLRLAPKE